MSQYEKVKEYAKVYQKYSPRAKAARKRYYEKTKGRWKDYRRSRLHEPEYRQRQMWYQVKGRAKLLGLPFDLTPEDLKEPDFCQVLGIPLDRRDRNHTPSVDRLIPEKGYTKENCRVISNKANTLKRNGTLDEFEGIIKYLKTNLR